MGVYAGALVACATITVPAAAGLRTASFERPDTVNYDQNLPGGPFTYNVPGGQVNDMGGIIDGWNASYDTITGDFTWSVTFDGQPGTTQSHRTEGFWLVFSDGEAPAGMGGEHAQFIFDASDYNDPILTAYGYNGRGDASSYFDGSSAPGMQAPDTIFSSLNGGSFINSIAVNEDVLGRTTMSFSINNSVLENHNPMFPDPDEPFQGVDFFDQVGVWFHPVTNVSAAYNGDGFLDSFAFERHGWWDGGNIVADAGGDVPAPGALALLGLAAMIGRRTRRN